MIENLFANTNSPYRLCIVDNGSTDGTIDWLPSLKNKLPENCQSIDFKFNSENRGIAIGRNQGLKLANKYNDPYLATMDNDVEIPLGWLKECTDIIDANSNFCIGVNMEDKSYPLKTINNKTFQIKSAGNLGTAAMVFPRKLHQAIGYFYGYENLYGEEDPDWGCRARVAGYQMGYIQSMGNHFGVGELDTGEYRAFKDKCHKDNLAKYKETAMKYMRREKPIYIDFKE
jgi:GT2 family glycosyltransferase